MGAPLAQQTEGFLLHKRQETSSFQLDKVGGTTTLLVHRNKAVLCKLFVSHPSRTAAREAVEMLWYKNESVSCILSCKELKYISDMVSENDHNIWPFGVEVVAVLLAGSWNLFIDRGSARTLQYKLPNSSILKV